jgi:hypothetical protein
VLLLLLHQARALLQRQVPVLLQEEPALLRGC